MFRLKADGPVGLLAGTGDLPFLFAEAAASLKKNFVLFGLNGYTDRRIERLSAGAHYIDLGAFGSLPGLLRREKIRQVVLAGGVPKKEIYNPALRLDDASKGILARTPDRGDDHLLRAFEVYLKVQAGVSVVDPRRFLKELLATKGVLTRRAPTEGEKKDLRFGWRVAKAVGRMDIGQTVVVKEGIVLAVEAIEGTDAAIRRGGALCGSGAVVVKVAKPNQDLRFDLPCVGDKTLESLAAASSRVLGVEAGKTLLLSKKKLVEAADRLDITLVGL
ncbi:MAG TPA: UDP-2,3-diacylglucosamine diphosphatase LpxI [Candidatus Eisenbacteria bacterium]|nr:UDP-2,3-diacylglucosamine diphosphatase LpxI [Candidatus Eisenbacteria bacterium]